MPTSLGKVGIKSEGQNSEAFLQDLGLGGPEEEWARLGRPRPTEEEPAKGALKGNWARPGRVLLGAVKPSAWTMGCELNRGFRVSLKGYEYRGE